MKVKKIGELHLNKGVSPSIFEDKLKSNNVYIVDDDEDLDYKEYFKSYVLIGVDND